MSKQRILLVYPNERDMSLVPPVIGLFSSLLKEKGHKVSLFDSTGYDFEGKMDSDVEAEKNLFNAPIDAASSKGIIMKLTNMYDDFVNKVEEFQPTLIAMTVTESTFIRGIKLIDHLRFKRKYNILTIVGGVFATFAPERVIMENAVDIVCIGEGEDPIVKLCERLEKSKSFLRISNLWIKKKDGTVVKNNLGPAVDMNLLPPIDYTIFEDDRFYRPMRGKIYRMLPVETHRGCPFTCTFCNSPAQNLLYDDQTKSKFFRKKSVEKIREELILFRDNWKGNYVFFWADTFLAWSQKELTEFAEMYSEFKFPFWCQSRPETVGDNVKGYEKLKILKDVGLHHMSFGMEHGNEEYRGKVIGRPYKNKNAIQALKNPVKLDIPITINNIIGFPDETPSLTMDTIEINRKIESYNLSCSTFAPFKGTVLRKYAEDKGYIDKDLIAPPNVDWSTLDMPNFSKEEIFGLQRTFVMYVKFPKSRWPEIDKATKLTPQGDKIWDNLRKEFGEKYFQEVKYDIAEVND
jgi:anaerobic magnesium-protoporphyrin IX monomethyl ester cyclase